MCSKMAASVDGGMCDEAALIEALLGGQLGGNAPLFSPEDRATFAKQVDSFAKEIVVDGETAQGYVDAPDGESEPSALIVGPSQKRAGLFAFAVAVPDAGPSQTVGLDPDQLVALRAQIDAHITKATGKIFQG